jgi:hypothetical protein
MTETRVDRMNEPISLACAALHWWVLQIDPRASRKKKIDPRARGSE